MPLTLTILVQNLTSGGCSALAGAYVDVWHCDAKGIYSDEASYNPGGGTGVVTTTGQKFLRGYQIADANGQVQFTTIYPGWYSGRTIHVHVRVRTYSGATVLGNFVSQIFFDDSISNIVLAQAAYSRSTARDTVNSNDMVYNVANQTRMLASVTGSVGGAGYAATITMGVSLATPAAAAPLIAAGGVGNAFSGAAGVSPNSWISIYGSDLSSTTRTLANSDLVGGAIPQSLGGASLQINGKAAYVAYVSPGQINVLAPADTSAGSVAVSATNAAGTSNSVTTTMSDVLPGLAALSNYVRAVRYPDGAIVNGTGNAESGFTTTAAVAPAMCWLLFGTGFGPTDTSPAPGVVFTGAYPTTNRVTVTNGGVYAEVLWAGLSVAGLDQINVVVPPARGDGDHPVIAAVAGSSSQSAALLKVVAGAALSARNSARGAALVRLGRSPIRGYRNSEEALRIAGLFGTGRRAGAPRNELHRAASG